MAFCTYVTEMGRSLRVQIQLAVTPGPHHTDYLTYKPRPRPPPPAPTHPHRGIVDCAIWRNISLLWLQWQRNAHYIYQIARECSKKKLKQEPFQDRPPSEEFFSYLRCFTNVKPRPPDPTTRCGKTNAPTFFTPWGSFLPFSFHFSRQVRKLINDKKWQVSTKQIQALIKRKVWFMVQFQSELIFSDIRLVQQPRHRLFGQLSDMVKLNWGRVWVHIKSPEPASKLNDETKLSVSKFWHTK